MKDKLYVSILCMVGVLLPANKHSLPIGMWTLMIGLYPDTVAGITLSSFLHQRHLNYWKSYRIASPSESTCSAHTSFYII